jgi:transcriptional regulator of arginine metabolism
MHIMQTKERRERIRELIHSNPQVTQDELVAQLRQEGFQLTQSTLSRDLAELKIGKRKGIYVFTDEPKSNLKLLGFISALPAGQNLIIIRTEIGAAQRVGVIIDQMAVPGVVGTLAGDDTIFIALENGSAQRAVFAALESAN